MSHHQISDLIQTADWKKEKHAPVIECPDALPADAFTEITVSLGKELAHPNTTEHHIRWIALYFLPEGAKLVQQVGRFEFTAHGESPHGPNEGPLYTHHAVTASMKTSQPGMLYAEAYCNIHGLWQSSKQITVR